MKPLSNVYDVCREEAQEKILKSTKQSGSDSLVAWEEELNDVS